MFLFFVCVSECVFFFPGLALIDAGEAMRELGEVKDALDMEVKQNFIDPLQNLHEKDLKEIQVRVENFDAQPGKKTRTRTTWTRIQIYFLVFFCSIT